MNSGEILVVECLFVIVALLVAGVQQLLLVEQDKKRYGRHMNFAVKLRFCGGLNLLPNVMCKVICFPEELVVEASSQSFHIPDEKLVFVKKMSKTDIIKQYTPNVGGAVAGALIAGPIGALIGGSGSVRTVRLKSKYLVIAYQGEREVQYILFDAVKNPSMVNKMRNHYKYLAGRESIRVDL